MTKKGQTSHMPKPAPPKETTPGKQPRLIKEYHTKKERDAALQRWLLIGTGIVIAVAVVLLGIAIISALVQPTQPAATVNGATITVGELQTEVRLERALRNVQLNETVNQYRALGASDDQISQFLQSQPPFSTWISEASVPDQIGNTVLNQMIDNRLAAAAAAERGITVDQGAVDERIQEFFGFDPAAVLNTPTPTSEPTASPTPLVSPTPTLTPTATLTPEVTPTASLTPVASATPSATPNATEVFDQFETVRDSFLDVVKQESGLGDAEIRALFEREALQNALRDAVTADIAREEQFLNARVIEVDSEQRANDIVAAVNNGESFADLARANSSHSSAATGGEMDWRSLTNLSSEFGDDVRAALQDAQPGAVIGPVTTDAGTYVVFQVRAAEPRELSDAEFEAARNQAYDDFMTDLRQSADVSFTNNWIGNIPLEPRLAIRAAQ
jgi:parvulin-like peptidyl-prolyl isomerase